MSTTKSEDHIQHHLQRQTVIRDNLTKMNNHLCLHLPQYHLIHYTASPTQLPTNRSLSSGFPCTPEMESSNKASKIHVSYTQWHYLNARRGPMGTKSSG